MEADLKDSNRQLTAVGFYISFRSADLKSLGGVFARLDTLGIAAADRLVSQYKSMMKATVTKLDALFATDDYRHPAAERLRLARQIGALIAAVQPDGPDLAALAGTDPLLAAAYRQAPACASPGTRVPTTPLPAAADDTDLQACADGNCEILVHQIAKVTVKGIPLDLVVLEGVATVATADPNDPKPFRTPLSEAGPVRWGSKDSWTQAQLTGLNLESAVVKFSSS